jgi:uncharacterized membrane protein
VPPERSRSRRVYLDWARGLAVLLMIEWHTVDAWTRTADRQSSAFGKALILGGFAAPLFLWLAGLGVAFSAARLTHVHRATRQAVHAVVRRGLEIFILAFLFRLQAFIVSPGAYLVTIFRVDVLNVMGPSLVLTGLLWPLGGRRGAPGALIAVYGAAAAATALLTPIIRAAAVVGRLPLGLQWYIRPAGDLTTFTMFPWAGFVFAGAACGVLLARVETPRTEPRVVAGIAVAGAALYLAGRYLSMQPTIYRDSSFWTTSPTWFAMRVGILMAAVGVIYAVAALAARANARLTPLERCGRASLFVYWIHVELVYGYASWPLHGRLPLWVSLVGCAGFSALMYGAIIARDRVLEKWRATPRKHAVPQTATA